mmetsp:Transcript_77227/g.230066  ORF Transcript_77227/g.230066 Transcript_77227/m.230066 type:complete len:299 (-) Transcript_77227:286-1182(-)
MPRDAVGQPNQQIVEFDVALLTVLIEQRIWYVLLHHIDGVGLGKAQALLGPGAADHARPPVPVGLLHKPGHGRGIWCLRRRRLAHPALVRDDVGQRHEVGHEVVQLPLVLQPDAALDVHGYSAEVGLVREVDAAPAEGAVADLCILVLEPLLAGVDPPVRALQQVGAEALAVPAHPAIRAVEPLPALRGLGGRRAGGRLADDSGTAAAGNVIDGLPHHHHLLVALLNLLLHAPGLLRSPSLLDRLPLESEAQVPRGKLHLLRELLQRLAARGRPPRSCSRATKTVECLSQPRGQFTGL